MQRTSSSASFAMDLLLIEGIEAVNDLADEARNCYRHDEPPVDGYEPEELPKAFFNHRRPPGHIESQRRADLTQS
jgi:hypothetical protein